MAWDAQTVADEMYRFGWTSPRDAYSIDPASDDVILADGARVPMTAFTNMSDRDRYYLLRGALERARMKQWPGAAPIASPMTPQERYDERREFYERAKADRLSRDEKRRIARDMIEEMNATSEKEKVMAPPAPKAEPAPLEMPKLKLPELDL